MVILGIFISLWAYGFKKSIQVGSLIIFVVYGIYIVCTTVVFRPLRDESRVLNLIPFWSYSAIKRGETQLIEENLMNVLAFVPVGLLLAIGLKKAKCWQVVSIGGLVSVIVELLQFHFKRGLCEFDDCLHNMIGGLLGYLLIKGLVLLYDVVNIRNRHDEVR